MVGPTPFPEVNIVLDELLPGAKNVLGEELAGAYLFGSLANGDFDRASDVDILFTTQGELSGEQFGGLKELHKRITEIDSWYATQLEVSYIPLPALRRYDPAHDVHPRLDRGEGESLYMMRHDSDWIVQRHLIREKGIPLWGPPAQSLIDPISPDDLRQAMRPVLCDWLAHLHETPDQIRQRGYQSYIVLTVCRVLYTLETGAVLSKRLAAEWAKKTLNPCWALLIERAWLGRQNPEEAAGTEELEMTFDFIRYALERSIGLQSDIPV
jgi:predicted nucleotidyltransferase